MYKEFCLILILKFSLCLSLHGQIFNGKWSREDSLEYIKLDEGEKLSYKKWKEIKNKQHLAASDFKLSLNTTASAAINLDFEGGNLNGWSTFSGSNLDSYLMSDLSFSISPGSACTVIPSNLTDPYCGLSLTSPFGGNWVAKVNDNNASTIQNKIRNTFKVTSDSNLLKVAYLNLLQRATHSCVSQPYVAILIRDTLGAILLKHQIFACDTVNAIGLPPGGCLGTNQANYSYLATPNGLYYSNWKVKCIDLTSLINRKVVIEVIGASCTLGGHWGYCYVDFKIESCPNYGNPNSLMVDNTLLNLNSNYVRCQSSTCSTSLTLTAPAWASDYEWNGPPGSYIYSLTSQSIQAQQNGLYTLQMNNITGCPIIKTIYVERLSNATPLITPTNSVLCLNSKNIVSVSNVGLNVWANGNASDQIIVTPTTLGIYTLSSTYLTNSGCSSTRTYSFNVLSNPSLSIAGSHYWCSPSGTTLQANGANSYTWTYGTAPNQVNYVGQIINPPPGTITLNGVDANGCKASRTDTMIFINPNYALNGNLTPTTICVGDTAKLTLWTPYSGPGTYTINTGVNIYTITANQTVPLTPSITTIYTISTYDQCLGTNNHTIAVIVNTVSPFTYTLLPPYCRNSYKIQFSAGNNYQASQQYSITTSGIMTVNTPTNIIIVTGTSINSTCKTTQTIQLSPFNGVPPILTSTNSICGNSNTTLNISGSSSGVYSVTPLNWFWQPISPTFTTVGIYTYSVIPNTSYHMVESVDFNGCVSYSIFPYVNNTSTLQTYVHNNNTFANSYTLCSGQTVTIEATGFPTYSWSTGLNTSSLVLSPSVTTVYTVQGFNSCMSASKTFTINKVNMPVASVTINSSANPICQFATATLSANGAVTYTWNGGPLTSTFQVSAGFTMPSKEVFYTDINGCRSFTNISLSTYTPNISISGSNSLCLPASMIYTPQGAINYTWVVNPAILGTSTFVTNTFSFSPMQTLNSIYNFTLTGVDANNCKGAKKFTIYSTVPPTITFSPVWTSCPGIPQDIYILNPSVSPNTFTWSTGDIGSVTTIAPTSTTIYTIQTIYNSNGCLGTYTLHVPILTGNNSITYSISTNSKCENGNAININYSNPNNEILNWSIDVNSGFDLSVPGSYPLICYYTDQNSSCKYFTPIQNLSVIPSPSTSISIPQNNLCIGNSPIQLFGNYSNGNFFGVNVTNNIYNPINTTISSVVYQYIDINGCQNTDHSCVSVNLCTNLTSESKIYGVQFFPNPFKDLVHLRIQDITDKEIEVLLFDAYGKIVLKNILKDNLSLDVTNLSSGAYILQYKFSNGEVGYSKLIKL